VLIFKSMLISSALLPSASREIVSSGVDPPAPAVPATGGGNSVPARGFHVLDIPVVVTADEIVEIVEKKGIRKAAQEVDVVTTATFGPMCSSGAFINFGNVEPPIRMSKVWLNDVPVFAGLANLEVISFSQGLPGTTFINGMLKDCPKLRRAELGDTSHVTHAHFLFANNVEMEVVPVMDTSSCENFAGMFSGMLKLKCISKLDTRAGTDMTGMFQDTPLLTSPDATAQAALMTGAVHDIPCPTITTT